MDKDVIALIEELLISNTKSCASRLRLANGICFLTSLWRTPWE